MNDFNPDEFWNTLLGQACAYVIDHPEFQCDWEWDD